MPWGIRAQTVFHQGQSKKYAIGFISGLADNAEYSWIVVPANGTSTDMAKIKDSTATITWDGPVGFYTLKAVVIDGHGCLSDTISQLIEIIAPEEFTVDAGSNTTLGNCNAYILQPNLVKKKGITYSYAWQPEKYLNDAHSANPVFTPGVTTTYRLSVTNSQGVTAIDSVTITVSEITANAGNDAMLEYDETLELDASASVGEKLEYYWTTTNGIIENGANTTHPEISAPGEYILTVNDKYTCIAIDTVNVSRIVYTFTANNDYDTTDFQTAVDIPVLNNDENIIGSFSLTIIQEPEYGTVIINNDYTISYTPNNNFDGNDVFVYEICNEKVQCSQAKVYVYVHPKKCSIPNIFSPNGDGIQDYFRIRNIEEYPEAQIWIYNRKGKLLYTQKSYGNTSKWGEEAAWWNGYKKQGNKTAEVLPSGTYFYILDLHDGSQPISGYVFLYSAKN